MTTIVQISDTHLVARGKLVSQHLDTAASLERLVARLARVMAQIEPVDAILVTGDVSDDGSAASYDLFRSLMAPLAPPIFVIPGNHDLRSPLRAGFAADGYLPHAGRLNWRQQVGDIDLIGLDTLIEGTGGGTLDASTLEFLRVSLDAAGQRPVLLAMHHPPFSCGIAFMDRIGLSGVAELTRILHRHDTEIRVVCGHIHNTMIATIGGKVAVSSPSPCSSFAFDLSRDATPGFQHQEDGFMVHRWRGGFQSIRIPMTAGTGPFPF